MNAGVRHGDDLHMDDAPYHTTGVRLVMEQFRERTDEYPAVNESPKQRILSFFGRVLFVSFASAIFTVVSLNARLSPINVSEE